jgi:hypothetical protein
VTRNDDDNNNNVLGFIVCSWNFLINVFFLILAFILSPHKVHAWVVLKPSWNKAWRNYLGMFPEPAVLGAGHAQWVTNPLGGQFHSS